VDELLSKDRIIQVGYQFRFHPGLRLVKKLLDEGKIGKLLSIRAEFGQYLPDWHPNEDYRNLYTAHQEQGGGIILDASHEIDYCRWLAGSEISKVACFAGKLSSLDVDAEDTADLLMYCNNNIVINIHTDFTQRRYTRSCRLCGEEGTIIWKYAPPNFYRVQLFEPANRPEDIARETYRELPSEKEEMYLEEMRHFISCIEGKEKPIVDGETGKRVLEIALAAKESAKERKVIEWAGT